MSDASPCRLGVDIGGTFTDIVLIDPDKDAVHRDKILTTPRDPSVAVIEGVARILANAGIAPSRVSEIIHGTTLVANAIIERKGVQCALVTTRGFRDVLEIGRERRYDTYDLFIEMPEVLVPRRLRFENTERIGPDGEVLLPLDEGEAEALAKQIRDLSVDAVAVTLLHAFSNDSHERRLKQILMRVLGDEVPVSISSEITPDIGEYERTSTTVANAYVQPIARKYLRRLAGELGRMGIPAELHLMLSDGGTVHHETAAQCPIRLVQSGPAGGVQAAGLVGSACSESDIMCLDIGGTTAKVCLIEDQKPLRTDEFEVARVYRMTKGSGIPLRIPVVDMIEIGAGGGSIARVDDRGVLQIGPDSASSSPGPACYGLGGTLPTVTDADVVLGYIDPDRFLGGEMRLDPNLARAVIRTGVAEPLGLSEIEAAWGIFATANESMAQAARIHAVERGRSASHFCLVPIGGAGPIHACDIAGRIGVRRIISLPGAGVASAFGALASPLSFEVARGGVINIEVADLARIERMLAEMEEQARAMLERSVAGLESVNVSCFADMRYADQGYEIEVAVPLEDVQAHDRRAIRQRFEEAYEILYGRIEADVAVEAVTWRVKVAGPVPRMSLGSAAAAGASSIEKAHVARRPVYFGSERGLMETSVYDRVLLPAGVSLQGPAILEERESSLVVPPAANVTVVQNGAVIVDLQPTPTLKD